MADDMTLSGRILPQNKTYYEYFVSAGGKSDGLILSLDEMGWLLGTGVLFKSDADKVMNLFSKITQGLEADCLKIISVEKSELTKVPEVAINGRKFPDAVANINLPFLGNPYPVSISYRARINSRYWLTLDREKYSGSSELEALDLSLRELTELSKHKLNSGKGIETRMLDEEKRYTQYSIDINFKDIKNSEDAANNIVSASEYVQKAVNATNRVEDMYKSRIKTLAEKLIS